MRDDLLRAQRNRRRKLGRQGPSFIQRIRVQRLRAAEHCRERLQRRAHNVVIRLLRRERTARGLRMKAQCIRPRTL